MNVPWDLPDLRACINVAMMNSVAAARHVLSRPMRYNLLAMLSPTQDR